MPTEEHKLTACPKCGNNRFQAFDGTSEYEICKEGYLVWKCSDVTTFDEVYCLKCGEELDITYFNF